MWWKWTSRWGPRQLQLPISTITCQAQNNWRMKKSELRIKLPARAPLHAWDTVSDSSLTCNTLLAASRYLSVTMSHPTIILTANIRPSAPLWRLDFKQHWQTLTHTPPPPPPAPSSLPPPTFLSPSGIYFLYQEEMLKLKCLANLYGPNLSGFPAAVALAVLSTLKLMHCTTNTSATAH